MFLFLIFYLSLAVLYLFIGVRHANKDIKASLKCLPILLLITWFIYQWQYSDSEGSWKQQCTSTQQEQKDTTTFNLAMFALIFSVLGDAFLVGHFKMSFPFGVVAFALAQVLYSLILTSFVIPNITIVSICTSAVAVMLIDISVFVLVYSRLKTQLGRINEYRKLVIMLILIYFGLISLMLWSSFNLMIVFCNVPSLFGVIGGGLFYVSDLFIALSAIYDLFIFKRRILVMLTYYSSQFFIALCILSICTD